MAGPQKRYRGSRQRRGEAWIAEIRHPASKNRIWLGKFETAEDAARAYDEAARLICGARARTNFADNPNASQSSASNLLSETVTAKLHRCNMASLQKTKASNSLQQDPLKPPNSGPTAATGASVKSPEKRPVSVSDDQPGQESSSQLVNKVKVESNISR